MHYVTSFFTFILNIVLPQSSEDRWVTAVTPEILARKVCVSKNSLGYDVIVLFDYKDPFIKRMIWSLKYKRNRKVARTCAVVLGDYLLDELGDRALFDNFNKPLLVPIPLSPKRLRERGYNQARLIAEALAKESSVYTLRDDVLARVRHTKSQTSLKNKKERTENVRGVFRVTKPEVVRNKNIILLDDVITTGSTMDEARRALLGAGARQVLSVALAH